MDVAFSIVQHVQKVQVGRFLVPSSTNPSHYEELNLSQAVDKVLEDLNAFIGSNGIHPDVVARLRELGSRNDKRSEEQRVQGVLELLIVPPRPSPEEMQTIWNRHQQKPSRRMSMPSPKSAPSGKKRTCLRRQSMPSASNLFHRKSVSTSQVSNRPVKPFPARRMPFSDMFAQQLTNEVPSKKSTSRTNPHEKSLSLASSILSSERQEQSSFYSYNSKVFDSRKQLDFSELAAKVTASGEGRWSTSRASKSDLEVEDRKESSPLSGSTPQKSAVQYDSHHPESLHQEPSMAASSDGIEEEDLERQLIPPPPLKRGRSRSLEFITPRSDTRKHVPRAPRKERRHSVASTSPKPLERKRSTSLPSRTFGGGPAEEDELQPQTLLTTPDCQSTTHTELEDLLS
jgi:hypothetical protein